MKNRFQEWDLRNLPKASNGSFGGISANRKPLRRRSSSFSVANTQLVILIENGGVDLGIPALVDTILAKLSLPVSIPDSLRKQMVSFLEAKIKEWTDTVAENFELTLNGYSATKGQYYDDVQILRNGSANYNDLKSTLIKLSKENIIADLLILTHGGEDSIEATGTITGQKIRDIKTENGSPLKIRSVYMMNCVGSSLNQAWLDAGAKTSCGTKKNNYLPEPTTFFFFKLWKEGTAFQVAASKAYQQSIAALNLAIKGILSMLPFGVGNMISIDVTNMDFVQDSAPQIAGDGSLTIQSKDLSFAQSLSYQAFTTTVVPTKLLQAMRYTRSMELEGNVKNMTASPSCIEMIKKFEGFKEKRYTDTGGNCSIGYGTVLHVGGCNETDSSELPYINGITETQATELLVARITAAQKAVRDMIKTNLNQHQFDALVSFVQNITPEMFANSKLLSMINEGNLGAVVDEMRKWTKAKIGDKIEVSPDLVKRRETETGLFTTAVNNTPSLASSLSYYSKPFYDTGEHSLMGQIIDSVKNAPIAKVAELNPDRKYSVNGVSFNYGQIMTMGDFYDNYQQMAGASSSELNSLKALIIRSENVYKNSIYKMGVGNADDPKQKEWGDATGGRYLDLAAANNAHFAPPPPASAFKSSTAPNNKSSWEYYHQKAIDTMRNGQNSNDVDEALMINAFGDHFLTDAFSAGHLINKELYTELFKILVLSNGKVDSEGDALFAEIAKQSFKGKVAEEFSKYQTVDTKYKVNGFLDDANMFKTLLVGILEKKPDMIANLFVKAIHDALNKYPGGVPVSNAKGQPWNLSGDGTLNEKNILMAQEAVAQSVSNVMDSLNNSTGFSTLSKKVWDLVPIPTHPATKAVMDKVYKEYSNFKTGKLVAKAVSIITDEYGELIKKLKDENAIEPRQSGITHPINTIGNWVNDNL